MSVISIPITEFCNMKCPWCVVNYNRTQPKLKLNTPAQKEHYIQLASSPVVEEVHLVGGEPLLFKNEVVDFITRIGSGKKVRVYTNATLLTPELVDYFNDNGVGVVLSINTYGYKSIDNLIKRAKHKNIIELLNRLKWLSINNVWLLNTPFADECLQLYDIFNVEYISLSPDYTTVQLWTEQTLDLLRSEYGKIKSKPWFRFNLTGTQLCRCENSTTFYTNDGIPYRLGFHGNGAIYGCIALKTIMGDKMYNSYVAITRNIERRISCYCPI